MLNMTQKQLRT